jgi:hypothetical protein
MKDKIYESMTRNIFEKYLLPIIAIIVSLFAHNHYLSLDSVSIIGYIIFLIWSYLQAKSQDRISKSSNFWDFYLGTLFFINAMGNLIPIILWLHPSFLNENLFNILIAMLIMSVLIRTLLSTYVMRSHPNVREETKLSPEMGWDNERISHLIKVFSSLRFVWLEHFITYGSLYLYFVY